MSRPTSVPSLIKRNAVYLNKNNKWLPKVLGEKGQTSSDFKDRPPKMAWGPF
jgi:hypothetical protein